MNKILILINVKVDNNPALIFFTNLLKDSYNVVIVGGDHLGDEYNGLPYYNHSKLFQLILFLKLHWILKFIICIIFRNETFYNILIFRLKLWCSKKSLKSKNFEPNAVLCIDTEAAFIASIYKSVPKFYFIYEFYADQFLNIHKNFQRFLQSIEKKALLDSTVIISSVNGEIGNYINTRYNLEKEILSISVTPPFTFNESIEPIQEPISIYYHGIIIENRGLENLVTAVQKYSGIKIFIRGEGDLLDRLKEMAFELNVMDRVEFLESVPTQMLSQVAKQYDFGITMARMNVLNHQYAAGFKTFENLSAGLALILPESYPLKKLNQEYKVGITYSDATIEELERVFEYILNHKEEIMIWKKNVRSAYHQEYNPARQKEKLIQKINQLIHA
jgi:glycosyltransferase involved in cell wall biosynthesis